MQYYPVIIPTLNRVSHLKKLIESLQNNKLAPYTELYIGVDYPPTDKYFEGYDLMCEFLNSDILGFRDVHVYFHKKNIGPRDNADFLINIVKQKYDAYIFSEDDNVFSSNFLEYMDLLLDKYRNDKSVFAVTGYFWPVEVRTLAPICVSNSIFSAWGYGTWFDREKEFHDELSMETFENILHKFKELKRLKKDNPFIYCEFIKGYFEYAGCLVKDGEIQPIDLAHSIIMYDKGYKMIYPTISKVRNMGNDGSGMNCVNLFTNEKKGVSNRNFDYSSQLIDDAVNFELSGDVDTYLRDIDGNNAVLKDFLVASKIELMKCDLLYFFYRIIGRDKCVALIRKVLK